MKCKIFNIRLQKENFPSDESKVNDFIENIKINHINSSLVQASTNFWSIIIFYEDQKEEEVKLEISDRTLTKEEENIYSNLKRWRNFKSLEEGIPLFAIAHNRMLKQMILLPINKIDDFQQIKGFGEKRTKRYGEDILEIIQEGFKCLKKIDPF